MLGKHLSLLRNARFFLPSFPQHTHTYFVCRLWGCRASIFVPHSITNLVKRNRNVEGPEPGQAIHILEKNKQSKQTGTEKRGATNQLRQTEARDSRPFSVSPLRPKHDGDPRFRDLGKQISDEYAVVREHYDTPKNPIVLAHGLMGFSELRLGAYVPPIHYWRGISDSLSTLSGPSNIITTSVPPSGSIEERAAKLGADIAAKAGGRAVNIVAHSMGGLDARYMISHLKPRDVKVLSLVTVATPHRGSAFADYLLDGQGPIKLANLYGLIERAGLGTQAFEQLTQRYMEEKFNPATPDSDDVRYFSYGACTDRPPLLSPFRQSHWVIEEAEGANDGLVSVASSRWGKYQGTLLDVSHLDLINWSNRLKWTLRKVWMGQTRTFNAVAFYLDIADMLAKEGL
ncbi:triacylglycerol lipase [Colletotrichum scovillei]|uniref:GPI inositol-deacylase n=2 Tax=Colletotrichum acutatum species complex TaxID=2707335 RepID=A0A9P7RDZ7_9PEZI|nr:triacylglycerol lipase [Colletotrichum scovillei]KAG7074938.1 triacylglycerol lipase [Colletotrichum scovillei]KAG7082008.1 triacylglycerol lipase [Colletotrichum scovillei]